ncbi:MAG: DMT family transporter [Nocardioidaceae bacterium]
MAAVLLGTAVLIGALLAVQASANVQLTKAVGTPYGASTLQLWLAAVLLALLAILAGGLGALGAVDDVPLWYLVGGLASPLYITSGILMFPRMGALAAGGLFVAGQMLASVALDLFGWLGVPQQSLGPGIAVGSLAVLAGITTIVRGQQPVATPNPATVGSTQTARVPASALANDVPNAPTIRPAWILLGLVAGAVLPAQGAINARLRSSLDQPIAVALVSFTVAALIISVVLLALLATRRTSQPRFPSATMPRWGWVGGLCAAGYVTGTFLLIPEIGASVTVALTVTGQQFASAAMDTHGWLRLPRRPFTRTRAIGLLLLVTGSLLVQLH